MAIKQSRYITADTTGKKEMAIRTTELDKVKDDPCVRKSEVQQTVNNSTLPVSSRAVKSAINSIELPSLDGYATEDYVDQKFDSIDLSSYASTTYVDGKLEGVDSKAQDALDAAQSALDSIPTDYVKDSDFNALSTIVDDKRDLDDNIFNGPMTIKSDNDEQGVGIFLHESDGTVRGQVVATDQGLQLTQYPKDGGLQKFTFPSEGGEVALKNTNIEYYEPRDQLKIGVDAGASMNTARNCIAIGRDALTSNTKGRHNIAIGLSSLHYLNGTDQNSLMASRNVAIGGNTGRFMVKGSRNILLGRDTGHSLTDSHNNVIIGTNAVMGDSPNIPDYGVIENQTPSTSSQIVAIGTQSQYYTNADNNVSVGYRSLYHGKHSTGMLGIGAFALQNHESKRSYWNTELTQVEINGTYSQLNSKTITLQLETSHPYLAVGGRIRMRFQSGVVGEKTYNDSQWFEIKSVSDTTLTIESPVVDTANGNITIYDIASNTKTTVRYGYSVALGEEVGNGDVNFRSVGVGFRAGSSGLGVENILIGYYAGADITGSANCAIGLNSQTKSSGSNNVTVGNFTISEHSAGNQNTAVGVGALRYLDGRSQNTAVGFGALSKSVGDTTHQFDNCTGVGYGTQVSGHNQVQLGNADTTTYVFGTVQNRSDARDKKDIQDLNLGLELVLKLRPTEYRWSYRDWEGKQTGKRKHAGFIAQELNKVIDSNEYAFVQDHSVNGGADILTVGYDEFIPVLVKAIQEQQEEINKLKEELRRSNE